MILILIFGEALALYGLIVSLILTSQWNDLTYSRFNLSLTTYHLKLQPNNKKNQTLPLTTHSELPTPLKVLIIGLEGLLSLLQRWLKSFLKTFLPRLVEFVTCCSEIIERGFMNLRLNMLLSLYQWVSSFFWGNRTVRELWRNCIASRIHN